MIDKQMVESMIPGIKVIELTDNMLVCEYGVNQYKTNLSQDFMENLNRLELLKNQITEDALDFYRKGENK